MHDFIHFFVVALQSVKETMHSRCMSETCSQNLVGDVVTMRLNCKMFKTSK